MADPAPATSSPELARLLGARLHDPFLVLGPHAAKPSRTLVRAFIPHVSAVELVEAGEAMKRIGQTDLFEWTGSADALPAHYRLRCLGHDGTSFDAYDPYSFAPQLIDQDLQAFAAGTHLRAHRFLGAHAISVDGIDGVRFAVWAPNAERVSVIGDFNRWDGRRHPMRVRGSYGVWELFIPGLDCGQLYKYELRNRDTGSVSTRGDPFGRFFEHRPSTATVIAPRAKAPWRDQDWLRTRATWDWQREPLSIYELHLGSWRRGPNGETMNYRGIAEALADYVRDLGFTHVEIMPITEYPLDESWGYQATGYFAPSSRYGTPEDFRYFVDHLHRSGIGVILDWVPGHFPRDEHVLARFDGTALYEYADERKGAHPEWGTLIFNYDRNEVRSFLISSAMFWLEEFHCDGLRVDAVASMLYLDYARKDGQWAPNVHGGNENLEAKAFLQALNIATHRECPGTLMIAEESTAWPGVSRPVEHGGLGFSMKWNMGWMHDTLKYMSKDAVHRRFHHNTMTFGPIYAFTENFVLPLSHDEVVHGKRSLLSKMPGDEWQRFANLRLLYLFQWTFPGKKLLFMGSEFAQASEWNEREALPWGESRAEGNSGVHKLVRDLNALYGQRPELHRHDFEDTGFQWLSWQDADNSVLSYLRCDQDSELVVLLNFTPVPRYGYRVGVPAATEFREIFNSDSRYYGGSDLGNPIPLAVERIPAMGRDASIVVTLPPLAGVILQPGR